MLKIVQKIGLAIIYSNDKLTIYTIQVVTLQGYNTEHEHFTVHPESDRNTQ